MITFFAFALIVASFFLPFASREIRCGRLRVLLALWFVLALHHAVSLFNVYVHTIFGAGLDAAAFHENAVFAAQQVAMPQFGFGSRFYEWYLAWLYKLLDPSLLLAQTLAVYAFLGASIYLLKIKDLLGIRQASVLAVLLFGLEPFMLLWTSVNLREPFQIFFMSLALYYGLSGRLNSRKPDLLKAVAALLPFALLHNGLAVYAPLLFMVLLLWNFDSRRLAFRKISATRFKWRAIAIFGSLCVVVMVSFLPGQGALQALQSGALLEYINTYRIASSENIGGSSYGVPIQISSVPALLTTGGAAAAHYFLGPFPWEIRGAIDFPAVVSTSVRLVLLGFSIALWRSSRGSQRQGIAFLLAVFISLELLWAAGTTNYGTAMRHHMVAFGIVVLLGAPGLVRFVNRGLRRVPRPRGTPTEQLYSGKAAL